MDPNPLFPNVDPKIRIHYLGKVYPKIRIHYSQMWSPGSGSGCTSKWDGSETLEPYFLLVYYEPFNKGEKSAASMKALEGADDDDIKVVNATITADKSSPSKVSLSFISTHILLLRETPSTDYIVRPSLIIV